MVVVGEGGGVECGDKVGEVEGEGVVMRWVGGGGGGGGGGCGDRVGGGGGCGRGCGDEVGGGRRVWARVW